MTVFELKKQNEILKEMVQAIHWMARRYADGRQSYVTSDFNRVTRKLIEAGIDLKPGSDGTVWARDAMGRDFDGLTPEEASQGQVVSEWKEWESQETEVLRQALSFYADSKNWGEQRVEFPYKEGFSMAVYPSPIQYDSGKRAKVALKGFV